MTQENLQRARQESVRIPKSLSSQVLCPDLSRALFYSAQPGVASTPQTFGSHSARHYLLTDPTHPSPSDSSFRVRCSTRLLRSAWKPLPPSPQPALPQATLSPPPSRPPPPSRHLLQLFGVPRDKHDLLPGQGGRHGDPQLPRRPTGSPSASSRRHFRLPAEGDNTVSDLWSQEGIL